MIGEFTLAKFPHPVDKIGAIAAAIFSISGGSVDSAVVAATGVGSTGAGGAGGGAGGATASITLAGSGSGSGSAGEGAAGSSRTKSANAAMSSSSSTVTMIGTPGNNAKGIQYQHYYNNNATGKLYPWEPMRKNTTMQCNVKSHNAAQNAMGAIL